MSEMSPCTAGEDLTFLAHCAAVGDFDILVKGMIEPEYLSPAGRDVAEWILARRLEAPGEWPPSYSVLMELFPDLSWPGLPSDVKGLDPAFAAADVWYSYKSYIVMLIHGQAQSLSEMDYADESYQSRCAALQDLTDRLKCLQTPGNRLKRFGEDPDALTQLIIGDSTAAGISDFESDVDVLEDLYAPYTAGGYFYFGRPKSTKTWRVLQHVHHHCLTRGQPGVYANPEDDDATIARRLACLEGGLDYGRMRELVKTYGKPNVMMSQDDRLFLEQIYDVAHTIQHKSGLVILGKESLDPDTHRISVERVFSEADRIGARVLFTEQVHKYQVGGLPRNATDTMRIHRVVPVLTDSQYLVIGSTQEKRKDKPGRDLKMPNPSDDWVFGGDAVAQNCSALVHVCRFERSDGTIIIMLTPVLGRDGEPGTTDESIFIHARFGHLYTVLPPDQGRAMCIAVLEERKRRMAEADKQGKALAGTLDRDGDRDEPRVPVARTRSIHSWAKQT